MLRTLPYHTCLLVPPPSRALCAVILLAAQARNRRVGVLARWLRSGITQRLLAPPEPDPDQAARARSCIYPPTACVILQWLTGKSLFGILISGLEYADKALPYRLI